MTSIAVLGLQLLLLAVAANAVDPAAELQLKINAAIASGAGRLGIPAGDYLFGNRTLLVQDAHNLRLEAEGRHQTTKGKKKDTRNCWSHPPTHPPQLNVRTGAGAGGPPLLTRSCCITLLTRACCITTLPSLLRLLRCIASIHPSPTGPVTLWFTNADGGFMVRRCSNVTISGMNASGTAGLRIDRSPPPFVQGTVTAVLDGAVEFTLDGDSADPRSKAMTTLSRDPSIPPNGGMHGTDCYRWKAGARPADGRKDSHGIPSGGSFCPAIG